MMKILKAFFYVSTIPLFLFFTWYGGVIAGLCMTEDLFWAGAGLFCAGINAINAYDYTIDLLNMLKSKEDNHA